MSGGTHDCGGAAAPWRERARTAAVRAAERTLQLAYYADAVLPKLPALGGRGRSGDPLNRLLRRCTEQPLLVADEEACDLQRDDWVRSDCWQGLYPPSHERHPWHSEYVQGRVDELVDEPAHVDYGAERAALQRRVA